MNGVRGSAFVEPEWIVMHPTDYQELRLLRDTAGSSWAADRSWARMAPGTTSPRPARSTGLDSIWNKAVYVTAGMGGAGTALVGSRAAGQVWSRGGLSVEATNSHASYSHPI